MRYETSIGIDAPPEQAWTIVSDVERYPERTASITRVEPGKTPFGIGAIYRLDVKGTRRADWTVIELVEGRRFAWRATIQGVTAEATHEVTAADTGSTLTLAVNYTGFAAKLLRPLIGRTTRKNLAMESAGMKRAAEDVAGNP